MDLQDTGDGVQIGIDGSHVHAARAESRKIRHGSRINSHLASAIKAATYSAGYGVALVPPRQEH